MGKVHGSLARAGKVRGQTPKGTSFCTRIVICNRSRGVFFYRIPRAHTRNFCTFVGDSSYGEALSRRATVKIGARKCGVKEVSRSYVGSESHWNRSRLVMFTRQCALFHRFHFGSYLLSISHMTNIISFPLSLSLSSPLSLNQIINSCQTRNEETPKGKSGQTHRLQQKICQRRRRPGQEEVAELQRRLISYIL